MIYGDIDDWIVRGEIRAVIQTASADNQRRATVRVRPAAPRTNLPSYAHQRTRRRGYSGSIFAAPDEVGRAAAGGGDFQPNRAATC